MDDLQESVSLFMFDYRTVWIFVMQESEEQILGRILNIIFSNRPVCYASMSLTWDNILCASNTSFCSGSQVRSSRRNHDFDRRNSLLVQIWSGASRRNRYFVRRLFVQRPLVCKKSCFWCCKLILVQFITLLIHKTITKHLLNVNWSIEKDGIDF